MIVITEGAPLVISQPHFYQGAQKYVDAVNGMEPSEDSKTIIDIEPVRKILLFLDIPAIYVYNPKTIPISK